MPRISDAADLSPPRTRGSTFGADVSEEEAEVSPAHAGIDLSEYQLMRTSSCLPRARGDRPRAVDSLRMACRSPPRTRGSTHAPVERLRRPDVSPAHAGIDPACAQDRKSSTRLPRARGDRPFTNYTAHGLGESPPRTRGSTQFFLRLALPFGSLPRARGDRPLSARCLDGARSSPPRTRGSTQNGLDVPVVHLVSPAHAGIDRR